MKIPQRSPRRSRNTERLPEKQPIPTPTPNSDSWLLAPDFSAGAGQVKTAFRHSRNPGSDADPDAEGIRLRQRQPLRFAPLTTTNLKVNGTSIRRRVESQAIGLLQKIGLVFGI